MSRPGVIVGIPHNGTVHTAFALSLAEMARFEFQHPSENYWWSALTVSGGSLIANNRLALVQEFLKSEATWLLQLDTDIAFPEDTLRRLMSHAFGQPGTDVAAAIVSGLYWSITLNGAKGYQRLPVAYNLNQEGRFEQITKHEGVLDIDGAGAGCLLVNRLVFEQIARACDERPTCNAGLPDDVVADPHGESHDHWWGQTFDGVGKPLGEDLSFFWRTRTLGWRSVLDTSIKLRHYKTLPIGD